MQQHLEGESRVSARAAFAFVNLRFSILADFNTDFAKEPKLLIMKKKYKPDERIAKMMFASVYPHYVTKVEKKAEQKRNYMK